MLACQLLYCNLSNKKALHMIRHFRRLYPGYLTLRLLDNIAYLSTKPEREPKSTGAVCLPCSTRIARAGRQIDKPVQLIAQCF